MKRAIIDTRHLASVALAEMERRRVTPGPGAFAEVPGGPVSLYGSAGAVMLYHALGQPLGTMAERQAWGEVINSFQQPDGTFLGSDCTPHALGVSLQANNLLGTVPPQPVAPTAPVDTAALPTFLEQLDWRTTHKDLGGLCEPLLVSGRVSPAWQQALVDGISSRIDIARPLETWCNADDPPWRVISCLYHVLKILDVAAIPYPHSALVLDRLLQLNWDQASDEEQRTQCTDGDWAWLLIQLAFSHPERFPEILDAIRRVSARRAQIWQLEPEHICTLNTHHLYCYVWVTALFQSLVRDDFCGPFIKDPLNEPTLLRLGDIRTADWSS